MCPLSQILQSINGLSLLILTTSVNNPGSCVQIPPQGWAGNSVVWCLSIMHKALGSIPRTTKKKKRNNNNHNPTLWWYALLLTLPVTILKSCMSALGSPGRWCGASHLRLCFSFEAVLLHCISSERLGVLGVCCRERPSPRMVLLLCIFLVSGMCLYQFSPCGCLHCLLSPPFRLAPCVSCVSCEQLTVGLKTSTLMIFIYYWTT